jgi:hypothetical protein
MPGKERSVAAALARAGVAVDDGVRVPRLGVEVRLPVTLPGGRVAIEVLRETDLTRVVGGDDDAPYSCENGFNPYQF